MSDTPETDASEIGLVSIGYDTNSFTLSAFIEFSRRLERERDALRAQVAVLREALEQYADDRNWRRNEMCDPDGMNFCGISHATEALNSTAETE